MFGGYEKNFYLCIRNRETNGASLNNEVQLRKKRCLVSIANKEEIFEKTYR